MTSPTTDPIAHLIHLPLKSLEDQLRAQSIPEEKIEAIIRQLRADYLASYLVQTLNG